MPCIPLPFAPDHPAFAGHFPGHPIVPGVLLLDWSKRAIEAGLEATCCGLVEIKFRSPAGPGDVLELDYEVTDSSARFEIRCGSRRIANGRFTITPPSPT